MQCKEGNLQCWLGTYQWLTPVILATQEAEIRKIKVRSQLGKYFTRSYLEKTPN
jgi:hypothetical protein